jgi:protein involved in polysaccharide export with SLBB domain
MECKSCCLLSGKEGGASLVLRNAWQVERCVSGLCEGLKTALGRLVAFVAIFVSGALMAQTDANYRLSADDLLDFRVIQEPELDAVIRIAGDGKAIFPLVGAVPVAGKTIGEATELLRQRYMAGYLANPQITLTVRTYARKVITILGQVQRPGSYAIEGSASVSLLDAIGMAGGYTRIANPRNVTVKRREGGQESVIRVDARKMARSSAEATFRVQPGDIITVGDSIF